MKIIPVSALVGIVLFAIAVFAQAAEPVEESRAEAVVLLKKIDQLYRSNSSHSNLSMEIVTPNWQRTMAMEAWSRGMDDTFIRVLSPKKDRGVATLKMDREMWNYFPKINKVIKVPPSMMMGSWMGSDFTNDDLVREVSLAEEYHVTLEAMEGVHVLTLIPKAQTVTVWAKIVIKVIRDSRLPLEQTYFNEKGEAVRVMTFTDIKTFSDRQMPSVMTMTPLNKSGHKTVVRYEKLQLDVPVEDTIFTLRNLQKRFR